MDKSFKKIFEEAIRCLNWEVIMGFYANNDYESAFLKKRKGSGSITKDQIKKELMNLVEFVLANNVNRFEADQWIIVCKMEGDLGNMIEIIFAPTKGCAFEGEPDYPTEDEALQDKYELDVLQELLDKSVLDENYELSAVLRDRMNKLKKHIKSLSKMQK